MNKALPLPPTMLRSIVGSPTDDVNFISEGQEFFNLLVELGLLETMNVFDIGSGCGLLSYFFAEYLKGIYLGVDVLINEISWCNQVFSQYSNFLFKLKDVQNQEYNLNGSEDASKVQLYYPMWSNFTIAKSLFNHLLPEAVDNYLTQMSKSLHSLNGTIVVSLFLRTKDSLELLNAGKSKETFVYHHGIYSTVNDYSHEQNIAYDERWFYDRVTEKGLKIKDVRYGSWCGRETKNLYEDVYIITK